MQSVIEKKCKKCGNIKSLDEYYHQKNGRLGYRAACKACTDVKQKEYYTNNKEKVAISGKRYRVANKEKVTASEKKYCVANKEKIAARKGKYRNNNKEKIAAGQNKYRAANKEKIAASGKKYYINNKEHCAKKHKEYMAKPGNVDRVKKRMKQNWKEELKRSREWSQKQRQLGTNYAKSQAIRSRIYRALKMRDVIKSEKSEILLGCKVVDAVNYLESLGYNRAIHEIDHIVPIGRFNMNDKKHRTVAFNYKNMQPLGRTENRSKQNKLLKGWESIIINICKSLSIESIAILNHIEGTMKEATI